MTQGSGKNRSRSVDESRAFLDPLLVPSLPLGVRCRRPCPTYRRVPPNSFLREVGWFRLPRRARALWYWPHRTKVPSISAQSRLSRRGRPYGTRPPPTPTSSVRPVQPPVPSVASVRTRPLTLPVSRVCIHSHTCMRTPSWSERRGAVPSPTLP